MVGLAGVMDNEVSVADETVSVVDPDTPFAVTLIVDVPVPKADASPPEVMVATAVFDDDQDDDVVMSWVVLSENVPVAINWKLLPFATVGFVGVTAMDTSVTQETVTVVELDEVPDLAVIFDDPQFFPFA
jgi:hypothetical protein